MLLGSDWSEDSAFLWEEKLKREKEFLHLPSAFPRRIWWCKGLRANTSGDEWNLHGVWRGTPACPAVYLGVCESRTGGDPALSLPACVLRLPPPRAPQLTFLPAGRAGLRQSAGPLLEDLCGLGSAAVPPSVAGLFLEGPAQIPDCCPPCHRRVSDPEEPWCPGAGPLLLAALRGGLWMLSALWHSLLHMAPLHAQVSSRHLHC